MGVRVRISFGAEGRKINYYTTYSCRLKYQSIHFMANFSSKTSFQELQKRRKKSLFFFFHRETCHSQDFISKWIISGHCPKFSFGILLNWGITHYHWYNTVKPTTWINADLAYSILQSERLWIPHGGEHIHQDAFTIEKNISLKKLTKPASRELWKRIIYFHVKLRSAKGKANN